MKYKYVLFLASTLSLSLSAAEITWIGTNNDMEDSNNWSTHTVPTPTDDAIFSSILNVSAFPKQQTNPFGVLSLKFPQSANYFNFSFENQFLFLYEGISGNETNTTLNFTNINNPLLLFLQVYFAGPSSTMGSSHIYTKNSSFFASQGFIENQVVAIGTFNIDDFGSIDIINEATNSNIGLGNDSSSVITTSQLYLNESISIGNDVGITITNQGTYNGSNANIGNSVGIAENHQFLLTNDLQAGENFNFIVKNIGENSSSGIGNNYIGAVKSGSQAEFGGNCNLFDNATITILNSATNSSTSTSTDFVAYLLDEQLHFSNTFQAGNNLSISVTNEGTDNSSGIGQHNIADIDSFSGTTGDQIKFESSCTVFNNATFSVTNNGNYSGTNTVGGCRVANMNANQLHFVGDFFALDNLNMSVTNIGIDSSVGVGGDAVGLPSGDQILLVSNFTTQNNAKIILSNSGNFSGSNSLNYNAIGSIPTTQFDCIGNFTAGDQLLLKLTNEAIDTSHGAGSNFIGNIINGSQIEILGTCTVGERAFFDISNTSTNSNNVTVGSSNIGSFLQGHQLHIHEKFHAGDFLTCLVENIATDNSTGKGLGCLVGVVSGGSLQFDNDVEIGNRSNINVTNSGTFTGSNTLAGNSVGDAEHQIKIRGSLTALDDFTLVISNTGVHSGQGVGDNSIGIIDSYQLKVQNDCHIGNNGTIKITNNGFSSSFGNSSGVAIVGNAQMSITGTFTALSNFTLQVSNEGVNTGNPNNTVGELFGSQAEFNDLLTVGDNSLISVYNSGNVQNSQLILNEGFAVSSGKATFQIINDGFVSQFGISILGSNQGGNANIILKNNTLNIDTTSIFTIGELNGDTSSIVQASPGLIIDTDSTSYGVFSGIIQDPLAISSTLTKNGVGSQKLSGINTYTGLTTVNGGTLILNGSIPGDMVVNSSGILMGNGIIGGSLTNSGTISPGESIGTMTFLGNFTNNSGNYYAEVNGAGQSDLIFVGDTAFLNGGTVIVSSVDGSYQIQKPYTILTAANVSGTYTDVTAVSPFLIPFLSYDSSNVFLTLKTSIINGAITPNQIAVAELLDAISNPNANQDILIGEIAGLSASGVQSSLDDLSGFQHTNDLWVSQIITRQFIRRLYDPLRDIVTNECPCSFSCDPCSLGLTSWLEIETGYTKIFGNRNAPEDLSFNNYEVAGGLQAPLCEYITAGVGAAYEYDRQHSEKFSTWLVGLYGLYRPSCFYALADLAYGNSSNHLNRSINVRTLHYSAKSKPKISQWFLYGEVGIDYRLGCVLFQPFLGIETGKFCRNHVCESESHGWGLQIHKKDWCTTSSRLGLHVTSSGFSFDIAWNRLLSSPKNRIEGSFLDFGSDYVIRGLDLNENSIDYAITFTTQFLDNLTAYIEFTGEAWKQAVTSNVVGGFTYSW